jgi:hypothetical protein
MVVGEVSAFRISFIRRRKDPFAGIPAAGKGVLLLPAQYQVLRRAGRIEQAELFFDVWPLTVRVPSNSGRSTDGKYVFVAVLMKLITQYRRYELREVLYFY